MFYLFVKENWSL